MDGAWSEDRQRLIELAAKYRRLSDTDVEGAFDVAYLCERAARQIAQVVENVAAVAHQRRINGAHNGR